MHFFEWQVFVVNIQQFLAFIVHAEQFRIIIAIFGSSVKIRGLLIGLQTVHTVWFWLRRSVDLSRWSK